jgi:hypothetical protein
MNRLRKFCLSAICLLLLLAPAVTPAQDDKPRRKDLIETLNEPETFGTTARFLGGVNSGFVVLDPTCVFEPGDELGPEDRCILITNPAATLPFDERDLGRVTLPANSLKSIIYLVPNFNYNYQFLNATSFPVGNALFNFQPYVTIESAALSDPALLNPVSVPPNQPFNGKVDLILGGRRNVDRTLAAGERDREVFNYTRAGGFTKTFMREQFNLPDKVIDRMFREPMTIRLNIRGNVRRVSDGFMFFGLRIIGN